MEVKEGERTEAERRRKEWKMHHRWCDHYLVIDV
jgi:hypothetical protein